MTKSRAKYLLANRLLGGDFKVAFRRPGDSPDRRLYADGITPEEHEDILTVWMTLDGYTCYTDAVIRIAQDGSDEQQPAA